MASRKRKPVRAEPDTIGPLDWIAPPDSKRVRVRVMWIVNERYEPILRLDFDETEEVAPKRRKRGGT